MKIPALHRKRSASGPGALARLLPLALALSASPWLTPAAQATQLVNQNLRQMIHASDLIVSGEVTKVSDGIDKGVPFTEVSIKVKNSMKKEMAANSTYTFRQYGLLKARQLPDGRFMLPAKIEGMPSWTVGEHVLSFMNKPASGTGLVTPVGLAQGKLTAAGGKVNNSFNNATLFQGVKVNAELLSPAEAQMLQSTGGAADAGVLSNLVGRALKEQWIEKGEMR